MSSSFWLSRGFCWQRGPSISVAYEPTLDELSGEMGEVTLFFFMLCDLVGDFTGFVVCSC